MNQSELLTALGPLAEVYEDVTVMTIMVDAPDKVYVHREGQLVDTGVKFGDAAAFQDTINTLLRLAQLPADSQHPIAEIRLPDGARIVIVLPPTAVAGPHLVIRKYPGAGITWEKLVEWGSITQPVLDFLRAAIRGRTNILIAGGASSGKTTVANLMAGSIPAEQRVILVEATYEMRVQHPRCVALEAGGVAGITMTELLDAAARMSPDWLIIGELTGPEALHALEVVSRGINGMMTIHADSAEDALSRLESMCLMANVGLGLGQIRQLIASAVQLVTYQAMVQERGRGRRTLTQIVELRGIENDRYILQPLFRYNPDTETTEATGNQPPFSA